MKKACVILLFALVLCPQIAWAKKKPAVKIPDGAGYVGTLPNVEERFQQTQDAQVNTPSFEYRDGFNDPNAIKPAPRDNPAFINIIMKKDKTSQYVNDLNDLISIIEKMQNIIESGQNIQIFNAQAFFFKENAEYFRNKYKNHAEQSFISYKKVMQLSMQVQAVAQLRLEKEVYSPYITSAGSGNSFSGNNINNQLYYLDENIKSTLVILKDTR